MQTAERLQQDLGSSRRFALEIIIDLPIGFPINYIIALSSICGTAEYSRTFGALHFKTKDVA